MLFKINTTIVIIPFVSGVQVQNLVCSLLPHCKSLPLNREDAGSVSLVVTNIKVLLRGDALALIMSMLPEHKWLVCDSIPISLMNSLCNIILVATYLCSLVRFVVGLKPRFQLLCSLIAV